MHASIVKGSQILASPWTLADEMGAHSDVVRIDGFYATQVQPLHDRLVDVVLPLP